MSFVCRGVDCKKSFSSKFNRNKHERIKGHYLQSSLEIPYDDSTGLFSCSTVGCQTTSKYKASIKKHLDICKQIKINKEVVAKNRICEICNKVFQRKSNRDRHVRRVHPTENGQNDKQQEDNSNLSELEIETENEIPSMAVPSSFSFTTQSTSLENSASNSPTPSEMPSSTPNPISNDMMIDLSAQETITFSLIDENMTE